MRRSVHEHTRSVRTQVPPHIRRAALTRGFGKLLGGHTGCPILRSKQDVEQLTDGLGLREFESRLGASGPTGNAVLGIDGEDCVVPRAIEHEAQPRLAIPRAITLLRRPPGSEFEIQLDHHLPRQQLERALLQLAQGTGLVVEDAQRTDRMALVGFQESAGIEAQVRIAGNQRIAAETRVLRRVRND